MKETILRGPSFILRPWQAGDEMALMAQMGNDAVASFLDDALPHPYSLQDAQDWIAVCYTPDKRATQFAIANMQNQPIGGIGWELGRGSTRATAIMGYWLGEQHWGCGIMTDVVRLCVRHLFTTTPILQRVEARVFAWNPASVRVLEKNGFVQDGVLRSGAMKGRRVGDLLVFGLTRGDFTELQIP